MDINEIVNKSLPEELQQKATPPIPMRVPEAGGAGPWPADRRSETALSREILNPLTQFDLRTPAQIKEQVELAKKTAEFFRNHWLWFYIAAGIAFYRGITATRVNAAIFRIDRALSGKNVQKNPRKKKK